MRIVWLVAGENEGEGELSQHVTHQLMAQGEEGRQALRDVVANGEFFLIILPDGTRLVHPIMAGERHPLNFGREVCGLFNMPLPYLVLCALSLQ